MRLVSLLLVLAAMVLVPQPLRAEKVPPPSGRLLPNAPEEAVLWWAPSTAAKVRPDTPTPSGSPAPLEIRAARNETDAALLVVRPARALSGVRVEATDLVGVDGARLARTYVEILRVGMVQIQRPSDSAGAPGHWPDPLLPHRAPVDLEPGKNHVFWIRLHVPKQQPAGTYRGAIRLDAVGFRSSVPLAVEVYDFTLPDRMTLATAFGFSAQEVFRYHRLSDEKDRRRVLDLYLAALSAHHLSPYDPAPLDPIRVRWPALAPPPTPMDDWKNLRVVENEVHTGRGALLLHDDRVDENVTVTYEPLVEIPAAGLHVRLWYRTAVPGHRFQVSLNHYDAERRWMSGQNLDVVLRGDGIWRELDTRVEEFPPGARYVRLCARAALWTERGEGLGLVWFDDLSVADAETGKELVHGGDFEPVVRTVPVVPLDEIEVGFDFEAWDRSMAKAIDEYHFNTFRVFVPGLGGGSFFGVRPPTLLGFGPDTPEYPVLLERYGRALEAHLAERGWLDEAFTYWFDEPRRYQYPFVKAGFDRLHEACPGIAHMLTEQVEPELAGGPDIWCCISHAYDRARVEARRHTGERFWWYVCTGPKAPYAGLFIDHPGPDLRAWLWQTFERGLDGILVWQTNYWSSNAAYPDPAHPQNPYEDPMSWTSGYGLRPGERRPWGNGDGRFLYPPPAVFDAARSGPVFDGPVGSIRMEHLRDGIEDHEYLCLLRRRLQASGDRLDPATRARLIALLEVPEEITRSLKEFAQDGAPIERRRDEVARAIQSLPGG